MPQAVPNKLQKRILVAGWFSPSQAKICNKKPHTPMKIASRASCRSSVTLKTWRRQARRLYKKNSIAPKLTNPVSTVNIRYIFSNEWSLEMDVSVRKVLWYDS